VETSEGRIPVPEGGTSIGTPAAAYSLRNLSTTYTGNVVDVRRSIDDAEESFTAEEVSDGTLEAWVTAPLNGLIGNRMYFDGADDRVEISNTEIENITFTTIFTGVTTARSLFFGSTTSHVIVTDPSGRFGLFVGSYLLSSFSPSIGVTYTINLQWNGSGYDLTVNGASEGAISSSKISIDSIGREFNSVSGLLYDVTINDGELNEASYQGYGNTDADWEDQSGSNNGTVLGSPVIFTGQGFDFDGFVSKWYDQSGNDNHATQGTDASQPKIVDGGSLVSGGLDFDGVDDSLSTSNLSLFTLNNASSFVVSTVRTGGGAVASITEIGNGSNRFGNPYRYATTYGFRYGNESAQIQPEDVNSTEAMTSLIAGSSGAEGYKNGTSIKTYGTPNTTAIVNSPISIGKSFAGTPNCLVKEAIFYTSDQSDNRTAIEANIGETYGITGIPAYDNTVDGFVETWYDQSGNGNDATQSVATAQPKIVDGGSLVTSGIDFDGVDDFFEPNGLNSTFRNIGNAFVFSAYSHDSAGSGTETLFYANAGGGLGLARVFLGSVSSNESAAGRRLDTDNFTQSSTAKSSGLKLRSANFNWSGGDVQLFENGVGSTATAFPSGSGLTSDTDNSPVRIGRLGAASNYFNGKVKELIIYPSDQSDNRTAIETNINAHYDIYA